MEEETTLEKIKEIVGEEEYRDLSRAVFKHPKNLNIIERGNIIAAMFNLVHAADRIYERNQAMEILLRMISKDDHSFHLIAMKPYAQVEKAVIDWWNNEFFKVEETGNRKILQSLVDLGDQLSFLATSALLDRVIKYGKIDED